MKFGSKNSNYKNGITLKGHFCIECDNRISLNNFYYGKRRCLKCACKEISNRLEVKNRFKSFKIEQSCKRYKHGISYTKEYIKLEHQKRTALRKRAGALTLKTIQNVYEDNIKQHGTLTCYLCLKPIQFSDDALEHKIPLSRNGTNHRKNLAVAHKQCNSIKGTKTFEEYKNAT